MFHDVTGEVRVGERHTSGSHHCRPAVAYVGRRHLREKLPQPRKATTDHRNAGRRLLNRPHDADEPRDAA